MKCNNLYFNYTLLLKITQLYNMGMRKTMDENTVFPQLVGRGE